MKRSLGLDRPLRPQSLPGLRAAYIANVDEMVEPIRAIIEEAQDRGVEKERLIDAPIPDYMTFAMAERLWIEETELMFAREEFTDLVTDAIGAVEGEQYLGMFAALQHTKRSGFCYLEKAVLLEEDFDAVEPTGHTLQVHIVSWVFDPTAMILLVTLAGVDFEGNFGSTFATLIDRGESNVGISMGDGVAAQFAIVVATLLDQGGIVETSRAPAPRTTGRKKTPKRTTPPVTVLELRRSVASGMRDVAAAEQTYMHRWIVRGHWRNQPHGPGRSERRRVYIAPYVKGPEGAPMKSGEKVFRW